MIEAKIGGGPPATSRHPRPKRWLLPSGPDQVHKLASREDQRASIES